MELSHMDENGAKMVDVCDKEITCRTAVAHCKITAAEQTIKLITEGNTPKGDVLGTAKIAGIQGGKRTAELIPMCHNIPLDNIKIEFEMGVDSITILATAKATYKTGVEMEALTAASIAGLTIYDMAKAVDKRMEIGEIYLVSKDGGKSGSFRR